MSRTDEIYGEILDNIARNEMVAAHPANILFSILNSASEFISHAYYYSYKLPILITRCNNVLGANQYPEKIIPKFICQLLNNKKLTIQGQGTARRNFIHVFDTCTAFETILLKGEIGEIYNISADHKNEFTVMQIAQTLVNLIHPGQNFEDHIEYVEDRKFNDCRYYISSEKLEKLGWKPVKTDFQKELIELIEWYKTNKDRYGF